MNKCEHCKYLYDERWCKRINRCRKGVEFEMEKTTRVRARVGKYCPLFEAMGMFQKLLTWMDSKL